MPLVSVEKDLVKVTALVTIILVTCCFVLWSSNGIVHLKKVRRRYYPLAEDLEKRPLPEWFDKAKIGIMVHIGIYSVPGYESHDFWGDMVQGNDKLLLQDFVRRNYRPGVTYQEMAPRFRAELFDPKEWGDLFVEAGAKYVVFTSKNSDGFTLFPSKQSPSWNSVEVGPHRDLVKDLSSAVKKAGLKFGVYYSLLESFHPDLIQDCVNKSFNYQNNKLWPELIQLVEDYEPSIIWADNAEVKTLPFCHHLLDSNYFLSWLYNDSPVRDAVVVNDRWEENNPVRNFGDFYASNGHDYAFSRKFEQFISIDTESLGYRKNMLLDDIIPAADVINKLVPVVATGGNIIFSVGATSEGTIPLIFQDRLLQIGRWLSKNGEAIYGTSPWIRPCDVNNWDVWYTCKKLEYDGLKPRAAAAGTDTLTHLFAIFFRLQNNSLMLKSITPYWSRFRSFYLLGAKNSELNYTIEDNTVKIKIPDAEAADCESGCALKFTYLRPEQ